MDMLLPRLTLRELMEYDGRDDTKPILLALNGNIYDVTSGYKFYGPQGNYRIFAGRDCTRNLSLGSLDPRDLPSEYELFLTETDIDEMYRQPLYAWESKFAAKYPIVGRLTLPPYAPPTP